MQRKPKNEKIFYGWWIVGVCFLMLFMYAGAGFYSFSIFIKPIEAEFGWDRAAIALTISIYLLMGGVTGPLIGKLIQRLDIKTIMTIGAIGSGVCFMLVSMTQSLWYFYAVYALLALFNGGIGIVPVSNLIGRWFDARRGTATGLAMTGIAVGGLVLAPVVGPITSLWGWKSAFLFIGGLVLVLALPAILIIIKDDPAEVGCRPYGSDDDTPPGQREAKEDMDPAGAGAHIWTSGEAFRSRAFRWMAAGFFAAPLAQMGVLQHQVPIIMDAGISETMAATALGVTAGMGAVGKLVFGRISEKMPMQWVFALCFGIQGFGVLLLLHAGSVAVLYTYVLVFGFAMGGFIVIMPLAVGQRFGLAAYGVIFGALWLIQTLGGGLGTYLAGLIYDFVGSYEQVLYAFAALYFFAVVALYMACVIKETPRNRW